MAKRKLSVNKVAIIYSWEYLIKLNVYVLESGTAEGKKEAKNNLIDLGKKLDAKKFKA